MLRRTETEAVGRAAALLADAADALMERGVISAAQKRALLQEVALRLT